MLDHAAGKDSGHIPKIRSYMISEKFYCFQVLSWDFSFGIPNASYSY